MTLIYYLFYNIIKLILLGGNVLGFQIGGAILDFVLLSILRDHDEYGYMLTQEVRNILNVSETAMYPALKRLMKSNMLEIYDIPYQGRNRRYYKITDEGIHQLDLYISEWNKFKKDIDSILGGNYKKDEH